MTLHTEVIQLSGEWQQITDGTVSAFVQVKSGVLEYVDADATPPAEVEGNSEVAGGKFSVTPPTQIWGRAVSSYYIPTCRIVRTAR